ncbi:MAG: gluconeogenesis factor YvcK family protein [Thermodesulfobacteriota bacterium]
MNPSSLQELLTSLEGQPYTLLDLLPEGELAEKLIGLSLDGPPSAPAPIAGQFAALSRALGGIDTRETRVVVFGGGTGLSNLIGGDSRADHWPDNPFQGLKELFPRTSAVVCVTDDGGSTGELLKDLSLIALGDLRHVLLSSVQRKKLRSLHGLGERQPQQVCRLLHRLFNHRFDNRPASVETLLAEAGCNLDGLPEGMADGLGRLLRSLFSHSRLEAQLGRPHCLGNLLLAAAILGAAGEEGSAPPSGRAVLAGIREVAELIGADPEAVLPCTTTPAQLKLMYGNGVLVSGECKSGQARRGYPVDRALVEFSAPPEVPEEVLVAIRAADIILFAPGSLFTSIVPILHVPGIAQAVRENSQALKVLVANLWAQAGETDIAQDDPSRRYQVSDLITAYHRNIPGGVAGLFEQVLVLGMRDIPGSILQSYALENKVPIYLDRSAVSEMGFSPVEARLCAQADIAQRRVIQHDPAALAISVRVLWGIRHRLSVSAIKGLGPGCQAGPPLVNPRGQTPAQRLAEIRERLRGLDIDAALLPELIDIFWRHRDIPVEHLEFLSGLTVLGKEAWARAQEWDNVFAFYDPETRRVMIREDVRGDRPRCEAGLLIALGQSLLGNYAASKSKLPVERDGERLGCEFRLELQPESERRCWFSDNELERFLELARMRRAKANPLVHTRLVNDDEGFTPPGLLFGLTYAWYLDNQNACHIEYKMSISRMPPCALIPEQEKITARRRSLIDFFRAVVFRSPLP